MWKSHPNAPHKAVCRCSSLPKLLPVLGLALSQQHVSGGDSGYSVLSSFVVINLRTEDRVMFLHHHGYVVMQTGIWMTRLTLTIEG